MKKIAITVFLALVVSLGVIRLADKKSPLVGWTSTCCYAKKPVPIAVDGNNADAEDPKANPYLAKAIAEFALYDRFGEHPNSRNKGASRMLPSE